MRPHEICVPRDALAPPRSKDRAWNEPQSPGERQADALIDLVGEATLRIEEGRPERAIEPLQRLRQTLIAAKNAHLASVRAAAG